jgi:hypothetical protein
LLCVIGPGTFCHFAQLLGLKLGLEAGLEAIDLLKLGNYGV